MGSNLENSEVSLLVSSSRAIPIKPYNLRHSESNKPFRWHEDETHAGFQLPRRVSRAAITLSLKVLSSIVSRHKAVDFSQK
jgi:hypothetical protein